MHKFKHRLGIIHVITSLLTLFSLALSIAYVIYRKEAVPQGFVKIITSPAVLVTDFILVGGVGAAFLNAALIFLFNFTLIHILHIKRSGLVIACLFTLLGFSFFGKNILNIIPFYVGGILYCIYMHEELHDHFVTIAFSSALAPFVSEVAFQLDPSEVAYINAILLGCFIGFIVCPLAKKMYDFHEGYNLYNLGFTGGIIGAVLASVLKLYNFPIVPRYLVSSEHDFFLKLLCSSIFLSFIFIGSFMSDYHFQHYLRLLKDSGFHTDFTKKYGYGASFINMGVMGFLAMGFLIFEGQHLNGPMLAGIFTVVGFSAYGKTPLNTIPIFLGVHLASYGSKTACFTLCLSGLFGTAMAPIAGVHGFFWGVLAGWLHLALVQSIGILHGGLNLYNNGFSCGIVASILLPLMRMIEKRKAQRKMHILKKHKVYIDTLNRHFEQRKQQKEED